MKKDKTFKPEYRTQFVSGTFKDYAGNTRHYTMCAVTLPYRVLITTNDKDIWGHKFLSVGLSVCSGGDTYNENMGKRIAYGKAISPRSMSHVLAVSHEGMINTIMVDALLKQESVHFEKDPGSYLAGYNADKEKYLKNGRIANAEQMKKEAPAKFADGVSVSVSTTTITHCN